MKPLSTAFLFLIFCSLTSFYSPRQHHYSTPPEVVDLFIFAGESNAVGPRFSKFPSDPAYDIYEGLVPNVYTWNRHTQSFEQLNTPLNAHISSKNVNEPDFFASEISFMYEAQRFLNKPVYMLKYAYGTTSVANRTNPQYLCPPFTNLHTFDWNSHSNELTGDLITYINDIKDFFAAQNKTVRIHGLFFWIGINDADQCLMRPSQSDSFKINQEQMIGQIRSSTGFLNLPLYISKLNRTVVNRTGLDTVKKRMAEFVAADGKSEMFSTDQYSTFDGAHFDAPALLEIGKKVMAPAVFNKCDQFSWANTSGVASIGANYAGYDMDIDNAGNIYVTGFFSGSAKFGTLTISSNNNSRDGFLAKYSSSGNLIWVQKFGGAGPDLGKSISIAPSGDVYVSGNFNGSSCSFGSTLVPGRGNTDLFIAKYSPSGLLAWARSAGGIEEDISNSIDATSGSVWIAGRFRQSATFGSATITSRDSDDAFLARYDSNGNVLWVNRFGINGIQEATAVAVDQHGNGYVAGSFENTLGSLTSKGKKDIFVLKYNSAGSYQWGKGFGGVGNDLGEAIAVDNQSNIYITGGFENRINSSTGGIESGGGEDIYCLKLNNQGEETFIRSIPGPTNDRGKDIVIDGDGNPYLTGWFNNKPPVTSSKLIVAKYNPLGELVWKNVSGGTGKALSRAIALDNDATPYITGNFNGALSLGTFAMNARSTTDDIFITSLSCPSNPASVGVLQLAETNKLLPGDTLQTESIHLIPNPVQDYVRIVFRENKEVKELAITNSTGEEVHRIKYPDNDFVRELEIKLTNRREGVYVLKILTAKKLISKRFIINRN